MHNGYTNLLLDKVLHMENIEKCPPSFRILMVIPTLGTRIETLRRTLSSIQQQDGIIVDIVIVSKISTPELVAIASCFHSKIIVHPGHISAAVNAGFAEAQKEHRYAAWIGDDDLLRPNALAKASMILEKNSTAVAYYGSCDYVDIHGALLFSKRPPSLAPFLLQFVPGLIKQEACLFRMSALIKAGVLDEKLKYTMDLDLLLRLRRIGLFVRSDQVHAAFCWHSDSLTIANRTASLDEAQSVQSRQSSGVVRILFPILKYPIRYLIIILSWKINRDISRACAQ